MGKDLCKASTIGCLRYLCSSQRHVLLGDGEVDRHIQLLVEVRRPSKLLLGRESQAEGPRSMSPLTLIPGYSESFLWKQGTVEGIGWEGV